MQHLYRPGAQIALVLTAIGFLLLGAASFAQAAAIQENAENNQSFFSNYEPAGPIITAILVGLIYLGLAAFCGWAAMNPSWSFEWQAIGYALLVFMLSASILAGQAAFEGNDIEPKFWIVGMIAGAVIAIGIYIRSAMSAPILAGGAILLFVQTGIHDSQPFYPELLVASNVFLGIAALMYGASFLDINPRRDLARAAAIGSFILGIMLQASAVLDIKPFKLMEISEGAYKANLALQGIGSIFLVVAMAGTALALLLVGLMKYEAMNQPDPE